MEQIVDFADSLRQGGEPEPEQQGLRAFAVTRERVRQAAQTLQEYKRGKANLERRLIDNEQWYKLRHWEQLRGKRSPGDPEPASAWLFNSLCNKHADAMDSFPQPNVLPREEGDRKEAQALSCILPVVLERSGFEQVYNDAWWQKLKGGTGVYGVFWDSSAEGGLGDIAVRQLDLLNLYWEPGIGDIQKSRNLFVTELVDREVLRLRYPDKDLPQGSSLDVAKYIYDDTVDTSGKLVVVDWYYKTQGPSGGTVLHYCKFVGDEILYASEDDPGMSGGLYQHGKYPIVFDVLFPDEGTPAGFGYLDIMKDTQMYIDKMGQGILKSSVMAAKPRFFVRDASAVNEEEFADLSKDFVHVAGSLDEDNIKQIEISPLAGSCLQAYQLKIDELKETSGNRDFSQGSTTSGVTAASAIAALQEAGSKLSRDMSKAGYRAFREVCYLCIELIRQFYTEPRKFRITGDNGEQFITYDNRDLRAQQVAGLGERYERLPIFDIKVVSQKSSPFSTVAQNEMAKELFGMGFFNPQLCDQALAALELMDFEGKELVRQRVSQNGTLYEMVMSLQQQMQKMAMIIDAQNGTSIYDGMAAENGAAAAAPAAGKASGQKTYVDALGGAMSESLSSTAGKARVQAAERSTPG